MVSLEKEKRSLFKTLRREIRDDKVISAMEQVSRELFVPGESRNLAYRDIPLQIAESQTISQPFIVAHMTSMLQLTGSERVLEVGTGSGYQAAILSLLVPHGNVLTLERKSGLAFSARERLLSLGYDNVEVLIAGGAIGYPERAPFDAIIVTAAAPKLPPGLLQQMAVGGRLVIPVGTLEEQEMIRVLRTGEGYNVAMLGPCRFVPLIGQGAWPNNHENL